MPISLAAFVSKWKISSLSELQSAQSHFDNLCELLDQPKPTDADGSRDATLTALQN